MSARHPGLLTFLVICLLSSRSQTSIAQQDEPFRRSYAYEYVVRSAELIDVTTRIETEIISPSMVQTLGQHRLTVNAHFTDLEIVEAATIKADGRRIEVQHGSIAELSGSEASTNILFRADVKTRVIPFPELAAGDRTVLVTRSVQKGSPLTGGASRMLAFPPSLRADAKVTVDAPRDIRLHIAERAMQHTREERGDRVVLQWTLTRQPYVADEASAVSMFDWAPMLAFSTYESWDAIGRRQFQLADPKSKPTEEIDRLAEEITRGISGRREQAVAIYDWVARNIRYFQVVLGQGGWEPHDVKSILANRYGDCKDHSTLMRALLRSKGIESEFVLINQQRVYRLFDVPLLGFDHMILYLPEFDLYVDPTATAGSLNALPLGLTDKPAVRIGPERTILGRTPALKPERDAFELIGAATVEADGTIIGHNTLIARGVVANEARGMMRQFEQRGASEAVKLLMARQRWAGSSTFDSRSPFDRADPYEVKSSFVLTSMKSRLNTSAIVVPSGLRMMSRPLSGFAAVARENRVRDFPCEALGYSEKLTLTWPVGKKIAYIPKNVKIVRPLGQYESSYKQVGRSLQVSRRLVWRMPGRVCTREIANDLRELAIAATRDFSARFRVVDNGFSGPYNDDPAGETPD